MVKDYLATGKDLRAIDEALRCVWHPKMDFVFRERSKIADTAVISYDSKFIYLWSRKALRGFKRLKTGPGEYLTYKIPHMIRIKRGWQRAWRAGLWDKTIEAVLPSSIKRASRFETPRISGGLLTPFISLQKAGGVRGNPYTTRESYLATIVHEFGHIYWSQHKLWWYRNKKENLRYLRLAKSLYQKGGRVPKIPLSLPVPESIGEVFAFCTEYWASSVFWPSHKETLDKFARHRLEKLLKEEGKKDLEREDSVLEPSKNPHDFAIVFGKIIVARYPNKWPDIITQTPTVG